MHSLLDRSHLVSTPIKEGDCGVILRQDGTFQIFSTGVKEGRELTPAQVEQGQKLVCLALALRSPQIMHMLKELANDPAVADREIDLGVKH